MSVRDALQHLHVLGPTGVGKSTLLLNLITADINAGRAVVVIDPKGDLVADVLARIPKHRHDDVALIDPVGLEAPVGINVLAGDDRELVADQVLAVFKSLYADSWGPRTQDILHAALLTLAGRPGMTLCALPVLLTDETFRSRAIETVDDPVALEPFWRWYDGLSEPERNAAIAPVMNKLRSFLIRPRMRAVLGQAEPRFNLDSALDQRKIVLVSLAKGTLGPEGSALLGSLIVSRIWQATLGRIRISADKRNPALVYIDEFQDYLRLPTDIGDALAQARGLGVGLTLAHQFLHQLPTPMRSAVLNNARSRIAFQLGHEDASILAAGRSEIRAIDFESLAAHHAYAATVQNGRTTNYASIRTQPPPTETSNARRVARASAERYGRPAAETEAALRSMTAPHVDQDESAIGRRRKP